MSLLKHRGDVAADEQHRDGAVVYASEFRADDRVLLEGISEKRPAAFHAFYRRYGDFVYTILLRTIGHDDELDDLLHEVFVRIFKGLSRTGEIERLRSWIAAVAVNTARDALKSRKRRQWLHFVSPSELPESHPDPSIDTTAEAVRTVYALLDELSVEHRIVFTLRYMHEMGLREVAEASGISVATAKRRLSRAKKQFMALAKGHPSLKEWLK